MFNDSLKEKLFGGDNAVNLTDIRYLPRWMVFFLDLSVLGISFLLTSIIIAKLTFTSVKISNDVDIFFLVLGLNILFMFVFKTFAGIIRHSTFIDLFKIFLAGFSTVFCAAIINIIYFWLTKERITSTSFLVLYFITSFMGLFLFRLVVKEVFHLAREFRRSAHKKRILVLGTDDQSFAMARAIIDNSALPYHVIGFISERKDSKRVNLLGKPIYTRERLQRKSKDSLTIDGVLVIKENLNKEELDSWVTLFLNKGFSIYKAPSVQKLRNNEIGTTSIKNLQIEDLLNRKPIKIDNIEVKKRHTNKSVLVTGGAGSIGSEIVRQVALFNPEVIVVLDQAETPLHVFGLELAEKFPNVTIKLIMMDVVSISRLEPLFKKYNFSLVYHAAAYKHVPLVEDNPQEAVLTNVLGSKNLALLSSKYKVNRFVMISTDKAVNPTNVMGATKRVAELYVQSLQNREGNITKFITTRFGNVLGSNGSVIPLFKEQIEKGGPLTITHPDIVRYFMTIPEACELVLEAGTMGTGGEVYVFDMGEPVKIVNLAKRMIRLSGFEPDMDIKIVYTGLRPGEKLFEELLSDNTTTLPTSNAKILISKDPSMEFQEISQLVDEAVLEAQGQDKLKIVQILKNIVKEFRSNNSVYEVLDK